MTVAQKFVIELPNESYVEESGTGVGGFQYELSREQAEELYNDLRVALGYSVRANDPGDAQDAQLAPPSAEELAAREQVLAALALQANPEPKERQGRLRHRLRAALMGHFEAMIEERVDDLEDETYRLKQGLLTLTDIILDAIKKQEERDGGY